MKTFKLLILSIMVVSFAGCSGDDDDSNGGEISASIVGSWEAVDIDVDGTVSTEIEGQDFETAVDGVANNIDYTVVFAENNTVGGLGSFDLELTASFLGEEYNQSIDDISPVGIGTYTVVGNNLTVQTEGGTQIYTIEELTDNLLTVTTTEIYVGEDSGLTYTSELDFRIFFERQ